MTPATGFATGSVSSSADPMPAIRNVVEGSGESGSDRCKESEVVQCGEEKENIATVPDVRVDQSAAIDLSSNRGEDHDPRVIGKAPIEISTYIFELYVQLHKKDRTYEDICRVIYPKVFLRLGAVCPLWRKIAWSYPRLWTTLGVDINSKGSRYAPDLIMEWLKRSGNLPLSIHIYHSDGTSAELNESENDSVYQDAVASIDVINIFSSRWENLSLNIPFDLIPHVDKASPDDGNQSSILRQLHLSAMREVDYGGDYSSKALFKKCSRKHSPTGVSLEDYVCLDDYEISWRNVTDFCARQITNKDSREVFRLAHLLETCEMALSDENDHSQEIVTAKSLYSLSVEDTLSLQPETAAVFLDYLSLPSLEEFYFLGWRDSLMPMESIGSLIKRSQCQIKYLNLSCAPLTNSVLMLIRALEVMPSLEIFKLGTVDENNINFLLKDLGTEGRGVLLLPNLEYFELDTYIALSWILLAKLYISIQSSATSHPSQRHDLEVKINYHGGRLPDCYIDTTSLCHFMQLRRFGIHIVINGMEDITSGDFIQESFEFRFPDEAQRFAEC